VAAIVLAFHGLWIGAYFVAGHEARDFIKIGVRFVARSHASSRIRYDPSYRYPANHARSQGVGYDGQFAYYMALDFPKARYYMDAPAYRYARVLYPVTAAGLALGSAAAIPYALILVNWLAIGGGTLALASWLRRRRAPPVLALLFGLSPGLLIGLQRDLSEPLAYALVAAAIWLLDSGRRRRVLGAALLFGLAGLARQTTVVFPLVYAAGMLLRGGGPVASLLRANGPRVLGFLALSVGPIVAYTAAVSVWLGGGAGANLFEPLPFEGLVAIGSSKLTQQSPALVFATQIVFCVAPSLLAAAIAWRGLRPGEGRFERAALLANVVLFVVFVNRAVYTNYIGSARVSLVPVVLAAVLCVPYLARPTRRVMGAMVASAALWMTMLPVIAVYGFLQLRV
jgi:hypothetical protein